MNTISPLLPISIAITAPATVPLSNWLVLLSSPGIGTQQALEKKAHSNTVSVAAVVPPDHS